MAAAFLRLHFKQNPQEPSAPKKSVMEEEKNGPHGEVFGLWRGCWGGGWLALTQQGFFNPAGGGTRLLAGDSSLRLLAHMSFMGF